MRFGYTILYVDDVEATLTFYEKAFGLSRRFVDPAKNYGELETGETRLAFAAREFVRTLTPVPFTRNTAAGEAPPVEVGLVTENVADAYRQALAGGAIDVKPPEQKPWGQTVSYVRDLNGFLVEICSPMP